MPVGWMDGESQRLRGTEAHLYMDAWMDGINTSEYINSFNGGSDGVFICNPEGL